MSTHLFAKGHLRILRHLQEGGTRIKILGAGFPCQKFSISQKKDRCSDVDFTAAEFLRFRSDTPQWWLHIQDFERVVGSKLGQSDYRFNEGLHLFFNCLVAIDRWNPDYYILENVSSMGKAVKQVITDIIFFGFGGRAIEIDAALVSAQSRRRIFFTNILGVVQPRDRKIMLQDVLDDGIVPDMKAYALKHQEGNARDYLKKHHTNIVFRELSEKEVRYLCRSPMNQRFINSSDREKSHCITANTSKGVPYSVVAEKIDPDLVAVLTRSASKAPKRKPSDTSLSDDSLNGAETTIERRDKNYVAAPVRIGTIENGGAEDSVVHDSAAYRVYSAQGKAVTLCGDAGGMGGKTGLYAVPVKGKRDGGSRGALKIYEVKGGKIFAYGTSFNINLKDGFYVIRALNVDECKRLQTVPEWYDMTKESKTQALKQLGNGFCVEVVAHILSFVPNITSEDIEVLSLYDGMSCLHLALDSLGATVRKYSSYEVDKYAIAVTQLNYPNTCQLGDAYRVLGETWHMATKSRANTNAQSTVAPL